MLRQALHDHLAENRRGSYSTEDPPGSTIAPAVGDNEGDGGAEDQQRQQGDEEAQSTAEEGSDEQEDEEDDDDDEEGDEEGDDEDEDDDDGESDSVAPWPRYLRFWQAIKNGIRIVANVENLWDESTTPDSSTSPSRRRREGIGGGGGGDEPQAPPSSIADPRRLTSGSSSLPTGAEHQQLRDSAAAAASARQQSYPFYFRTRNLIVLFWFVVLASSYAAERSTFKLLVDRAGPFRLFAVEMVTFTHALLLLSAVLLARFVKDPTSSSATTAGGTTPRSTSFGPPPPAAPSHIHEVKLGISIVDVALMALLESVQLILVFLTGVHVPPTLTVILIQFTLPLTAFLTQFVHPQGRCNCSSSSTAATTASSGSAAPAQEGARGYGSGGDGGTPPPPPPGQPPPPPPPPASNYRSSDEREGLLSSSASQGYHHQRWGTITDGEDDINNNTCGGLSSEHVYGSLIIFVAVALALVPAFVAMARPDYFDYADTIPIRTAFNTLLYVSSCIPAAASQLYKEHVFLQYKQPVNMTYLNLLLSAFEFVFCTILSPLVFELQGLGARGAWTALYPSSKFAENFVDGLRCFFWTLPDDDQESKYYDDARCDFAMGLTVFHAFAIISVGVAVDKIVNAGATKVMYRGMSAGIVLAVLCMHAYDMSIPEFSYGPAIDGLNLACLIILILGSEVYHRVALKDLTFDTVYQEVHLESLYDG